MKAVGKNVLSEAIRETEAVLPFLDERGKVLPSNAR